MKLTDLHTLIEELYSSRNNAPQNSEISSSAKNFRLDLAYDKYYGGHQFRLGHYFRHLYQSFKYLSCHSQLNESEKYAYGKMYRAQLSNYEQALLLVNSISSIGMSWELLQKPPEKKSADLNLITKFNLIKNLPSDQLYGIKYKTYYPDVMYESDEHLIEYRT